MIIILIATFYIHFHFLLNCHLPTVHTVRINVLRLDSEHMHISRYIHLWKNKNVLFFTQIMCLYSDMVTFWLKIQGYPNSGHSTVDHYHRSPDSNSRISNKLQLQQNIHKIKQPTHYFKTGRLSLIVCIHVSARPSNHAMQYAYLGGSVWLPTF